MQLRNPLPVGHKIADTLTQFRGRNPFMFRATAVGRRVARAATFFACGENPVGYVLPAEKIFESHFFLSLWQNPAVGLYTSVRVRTLLSGVRKDIYPIVSFCLTPTVLWK